MPSCAVATCKSWGRGTTSKSGMHAPAKAHFYRFPKEKNLRNEWVRRCNRGDKFNILNARVCSDHFRKEDFVRDLKAELLGVKATVRLLPSAVPILYLPDVIQDQLELEQLAEAARNAANPNSEQIVIILEETQTQEDKLLQKTITPTTDQLEPNLTDDSIQFFRKRIAEYEKNISGLKNELKSTKKMMTYHRDRCDKLKMKNHSLLKESLDLKRQLGMQMKVNAKLEKALDAFTIPHARLRAKGNRINHHDKNNRTENNIFVFEGNFQDLNSEQTLTVMREPMLII